MRSTSIRFIMVFTAVFSLASCTNGSGFEVLQSGVDAIGKGYGKVKQKVYEVQLPGGVTSTYQPAIVTPGRLDSYRELIEGVNQQTVSDSSGSYYHDLADGYLVRTLFNSKDEQSISASFVQGKGLVGPWLEYQNKSSQGPVVVINWKLTALVHEVMSKKLGLNLLPLSDTRQYAESLQELSRTSSNVYNAATLRRSLEASGLTPDYAIIHGGFERYYTNFVNWERGADYADLESYQVMNGEALTRGNSLSFHPASLIESSGRGDLYFHSACLGIDLVNQRRKLEGKARDVSAAASRYDDILRNNQTQAVRTITTCATGLDQLGVFGAIRSKRL